MAIGERPLPLSGILREKARMPVLCRGRMANMGVWGVSPPKVYADLWSGFFTGGRCRIRCGREEVEIIGYLRKNAKLKLCYSGNL